MSTTQLSQDLSITPPDRLITIGRLERFSMDDWRLLREFAASIDELTGVTSETFLRLDELVNSYQ